MSGRNCFTMEAEEGYYGKRIIPRGVLKEPCQYREARGKSDRACFAPECRTNSNRTASRASAHGTARNLWAGPACGVRAWSHAKRGSARSHGVRPDAGVGAAFCGAHSNSGTCASQGIGPNGSTAALTNTTVVILPLRENARQRTICAIRMLIVLVVASTIS